MSSGGRPHPKIVNDDGYVLLAAAVAVLLVTIVGYAIFGVAAAETKGAVYRQDSTEAFYLADAAIERARAKFLDDETWRDGWNDVACGRGHYDLALADSTLPDGTEVVNLVATGRVNRAARRIEAVVQVPHTAFDMALFIVGDAEVGGNLCLNGQAYIAGDADFGHHDSHLKCGGTYEEGYELSPPPFKTEQANYPNTSYYTVQCTKVGSKYVAVIRDKNNNDVSSRAGANPMNDVLTYDSGDKTFTFSFSSATLITKYFDDVTGVFRRASGDVGAVVWFGKQSLIEANSIADIDIKGSGAVIHASILNVRFTGTTNAQRVNKDYWKGGRVSLKAVVFEPYNGISVVARTLGQSGSSQVELGTAAWPGLVYVMKDADDVNSNFEVVGSMVILDDWDCEGGMTYTYSSTYIPRLPTYFLQGWSTGTSGTLEFASWTEVNPDGN
jgi:hypothetical protein